MRDCQGLCRLGGRRRQCQSSGEGWWERGGFCVRDCQGLWSLGESRIITVIRGRLVGEIGILYGRLRVISKVRGENGGIHVRGCKSSWRLVERDEERGDIV